MERLPRLFFKISLAALILLASAAIVTRFYFIPRAEQMLAETLRTAGYTDAVARIDSSALAFLTLTLYQQQNTNIPFARAEIYPWSFEKLRVASLTLSLPEAKQQEEAAPNQKTLASLLQKDFRLPSLSVLPYKNVEIETFSISLPYPYGKVEGNFLLSPHADGWQATAHFTNPSINLQSTATLFWTKNDGVPHLSVSGQYHQPPSPPIAVEGTYDGMDNTASAPALSAKLLSPFAEITLNPDKNRTLDKLPFSATLTLPRHEPIAVEGSLNLITQTGALAAKSATINGFPLANPSLRFGYRGSVLTINHAQANSLGGKLSLSPVTLDLGNLAKPISTTVTLDGIDLAQTLILGNVDGLRGTGTLSGTLPLSYTPDSGKLTFGHGTLTTQKNRKGTVIYAPAVPPSFLAEGGQGQILAQVFSDFHYDSLAFTLEGTTGDTLTLNAKIAGSNPSFYGGHPVSFNLTLSGDLDSVLQQGLKGLALSPDALQSLVREQAQKTDKK